MFGGGALIEPRAWRAREHEPITGVCVGALSGVQGQSPGQGVRGRSPPEAENLLASDAQRKQQICLILSES